MLRVLALCLVPTVLSLLPTSLLAAPTVPPGGGNRVCCTPNDGGTDFDSVCCDDGRVYRCIDGDFGWQIDCPTDLSQETLDAHCSTIAQDPKDLFDLDQDMAAAICPFAGAAGPAITFCGVQNPTFGATGSCPVGQTIAEMGIGTCTGSPAAICPVPMLGGLGPWILAVFLTATGAGIVFHRRVRAA